MAELAPSGQVNASRMPAAMPTAIRRTRLPPKNFSAKVNRDMDDPFLLVIDQLKVRASNQRNS
jgi:hypothetical protein